MTEDAVVPAPDPGEPAVPRLDPGDASLLALVDRLGVLLDRSELSELAVEAGSTRLVLRKPAIAPVVVAFAGGPALDAGSGSGPGSETPAASGPGLATPSRPTVSAPLTGVWYGSPAPGSAPFVAAGREVAVAVR